MSILVKSTVAFVLSFLLVKGCTAVTDNAATPWIVTGSSVDVTVAAGQSLSVSSETSFFAESDVDFFLDSGSGEPIRANNTAERPLGWKHDSYFNASGKLNTGVWKMIMGNASMRIKGENITVSVYPQTPNLGSFIEFAFLVLILEIITVVMVCIAINIDTPSFLRKVGM